MFVDIHTYQSDFFTPTILFLFLFSYVSFQELPRTFEYNLREAAFFSGALGSHQRPGVDETGRQRTGNMEEQRSVTREAETQFIRGTFALVQDSVRAASKNIEHNSYLHITESDFLCICVDRKSEPHSEESPVGIRTQRSIRSSPSSHAASASRPVPPPRGHRGSSQRERLHSSSLSSLGETPAPERRNSKLQPGSSRTLSQVSLYQTFSG